MLQQPLSSKHHNKQKQRTTIAIQTQFEKGHIFIQHNVKIHTLYFISQLFFLHSINTTSNTLTLFYSTTILSIFNTTSKYTLFILFHNYSFYFHSIQLQNTLTSLYFLRWWLNSYGLNQTNSKVLVDGDWCCCVSFCWLKIEDWRLKIEDWWLKIDDWWLIDKKRLTK